jgi:hypothetical protein
METNDWQAFNLATEALRDIDRFAAAPAASRPRLLEARRKLGVAAARDPQFLRAKYYSAIVADLLGQAKDAIDELTALIAQHPPFLNDAKYNLAVSHYHMYSREHVEAAIAEFTNVEHQSADPTLRYMSRAGLVRAYAMMAHHTKRSAGESQGFADTAVQTGSNLLAQLRADGTVDGRTRGEIEWRALNGRGVARMFASDLDQSASRREELLAAALHDFTEASNLSRDNWEIVCNLGSSYMRLGAIMRTAGREEESRRNFDTASRYLTDVLDRMRPGYGFALYELGRIERLRGQYATAVKYFQQALAIPEDERNVSVATIDREMVKARTPTDAFP